MDARQRAAAAGWLSLREAARSARPRRQGPLAKTTGKPFRLLSEAEAEYVARAGATTPFWWGSGLTPEQANYNGTQVYAGGDDVGFRVAWTLNP